MFCTKSKDALDAEFHRCKLMMSHHFTTTGIAQQEFDTLKASGRRKAPKRQALKNVSQICCAGISRLQFERRLYGLRSRL